MFPVEAQTTALAPSSSAFDDGHGHAAVLEAPGRVRALALEPELDAEPLGEPRRAEERRRALAERDDRRRSVERQPVAVALDERSRADLLGHSS